MGKSAIILGASGLTGSILLKELLEDQRYDAVKIFSRNPIEIDHPKLTEYTGDLLELTTFQKEFVSDEVFCCIGTTAKKTPDKDLYKRIDYGIPVTAAKLCKENHINTFLVISAIGANVNSSVFYNRTKGEMEAAVLKEKIPNTFVIRPSLILGKRKEIRIGESIGKSMMRLFDFLLIGKFKRYRVVEAEKIAQAMIILANTSSGIHIVESDEITGICKS